MQEEIKKLIDNEIKRAKEEIRIFIKQEDDKRRKAEIEEEIRMANRLHEYYKTLLKD